MMLKDRIVVITGSTHGYGYAVAEAMLRAGATVVVSGRSKEKLQKAVRSLSKLGPVKGKICDVRRESQVYALARFTMKTYGRIDVWINNAGYASAAGLMLETPPAQAVDMFLTNDMGTLYGTQAAMHFMAPRHAGTLVNLYGNGSFLRPASPTGLYGTTKAWIASFTRSLARETRDSGVRIIGFSPGMMLTDMLTNPTVIGQHGRAMLKNYSFVLRLLAGSPEKAARKLADAVIHQKKDFVEYRLFRPWTPLLGLLRLAWENLTKSGETPEYKLHFEKAYKPKI